MFTTAIQRFITGSKMTNKINYVYKIFPSATVDSR
jgi:hypothetical protein